MTARTTVDSDARVLAILEELKRRRAAGVTELAEALDTPKSTVHAHLATLREEGYVVQDDDSRYALGLTFLDLGVVARRRRRIYAEVGPKLEELAAETDEKVWCAVEENGEAVFVAKAVGSHAIQTNARVGQYVPLYRLAAGKAILANLGPDRREEILDGYDYPLDGTGPSRTELEAELAEVRDRGVAFGTEQFIQGVTAVAAPVTDNSGTVYGAINVSGPTNRLAGARLEEDLADLVRGVAGELQINLSYR
jgi:DNA-binding IclR family transcriptional regulator